MQQVLVTAWKNLRQDLVRFVQSRVKDRLTAEDIVHDVFIKVHAKTNQLREPEKISGWIFQVTRHAIADHFREVAKGQNVPVPVDEGDFHELNDCVAKCLNLMMSSLPEIYRAPLQMAEQENLSQYEIAERLGISYSGARSRVQRARKMLRDKFEELYRVKTDPYGNIISCEDKAPCCCMPTAKSDPCVNSGRSASSD